MKFVATEVVFGATRIAFKNDQGENIEAGTVFVQTSMDKEGQGFGYRTVGMKVKDLKVIDSISANPFPFRAELHIEQIAGSKTEKLVVTKVVPLSRVEMRDNPKLGAQAA